jgi:hypothetical protein
VLAIIEEAACVAPVPGKRIEAGEELGHVILDSTGNTKKNYNC